MCSHLPDRESSFLIHKISFCTWLFYSAPKELQAAAPANSCRCNSLPADNITHGNFTHHLSSEFNVLLICEIFHLTRQINSTLPCPFFAQRDKRFKTIYSTSLKSKVDLKNNSWGLHWIERHVINGAGKQQQKWEYCLSLNYHLLHKAFIFYIELLLVYIGFKMPISAAQGNASSAGKGREHHIPSLPTVSSVPSWEWKSQVEFSPR